MDVIDNYRAELNNADGYNSWVNWFIFISICNINKVTILVSYSEFN